MNWKTLLRDELDWKVVLTPTEQGHVRVTLSVRGDSTSNTISRELLDDNSEVLCQTLHQMLRTHPSFPYEGSDEENYCGGW